MMRSAVWLVAPALALAACNTNGGGNAAGSAPGSNRKSASR